MIARSRHLLLCTLSAGLLMVIVGFAATAWAEVPVSLTHQGRLADDDGEPLSGEAEMTFTIYDQATGGAIVWEGGYVVELDDDGFYTVELGGEGNPIDATVLDGGTTWIGITVDGTELEPRMALNSVPYAVVAGQAQSVADGAVGTDALAPDFSLPADQMDEVPWARIDGVPEDLADGDDDTLGGLSCNTDAIAVFDGNNWTCAPQPSYDGGDFALANQACQPGDVVTGVDASGNVLCAPDQDSDTTYSAGAGVTLNNDSFALDESYTDARYAHNDQSCPTGEVVIGLSVSGDVICAPDQDTTRSDSEIQSVIAAEDRYVEKSGSTMTGDLDTSGNVNAGGDVEVGGTLNMNGTSFNPYRMSVSRGGGNTSNVITYVDPNGSTHTLTVADTSAQYVSGRIGYQPGRLYFNIDGAPLSCTVLHREDDSPTKNYGLYFATDGGNGMSGVWGNSTTDTFIFQKEGSSGIPIATHTNYHLLCM